MNEEEPDTKSAQKIYKAFLKSSCSINVKAFAGDAGKYFDLKL